MKTEMYKLPDSAVVSHDNIDGMIRPSTLDVICPHCRRQVTVSVIWKTNSAHDGVSYGFARCSGCREQSKYFSVCLDPPKKGEDDIPDVYMYPAPNVREPIPGIESIDGLSDRLKEVYASAIRVYNIGEWPSASVACRRVLEGVTRASLPESEHAKKLYHQIESLPDHLDLAKPIKDLAHQLRDGGNLGAHFDSEKEPNQETVSAMLDLLDFLVEYLHILPHRIQDLKTQIDELSSSQ